MNFLITAITANVTSSELFFRDGRSLSSYVQESVIPDRHQRLEYNYSIDVLDIFKVSSIITLKILQYYDPIFASQGFDLRSTPLLYRERRGLEHKPLAREDTMANVFVYFRKKYASIPRKEQKRINSNILKCTQCVMMKHQFKKML